MTREAEVGVFWNPFDWTEEELLFLRPDVPGFRRVAAYRNEDVTLEPGDGPARLLPGISASAELFEVLGARPALGRVFQPRRRPAGRRSGRRAQPRAVAGAGRGRLHPRPAGPARRHPADGGRRDAARLLVPRSRPCASGSPSRSTRTNAERQLHARRARRAGAEPGADRDGSRARPPHQDARRAVRLPRAVGQDEERRGHPGPRVPGRLPAAGAAGDARRHGGHPPHRVRQRRRPDARPGEPPGGRAGGALRAGGRPAPAHAAARGRGARARPRLRRRGRAPRRGGLPGAGRRPAARGVGGARGARLDAVRRRHRARPPGGARHRHHPHDLALRRGDLRDALTSMRTADGGRTAAGRVESGLVVAEVALAVLLASGAALLIRSVVEPVRHRPGGGDPGRRGARRRRQRGH